MIPPLQPVRSPSPAPLATDALVRAKSAVEDDGVSTGDRVVAELSVHQGTGSQVVRLVDEDTRQVVGQVPPEAVLDLVAWALELQRRRP